MQDSKNYGLSIPIPFILAATIWIAYYWNISNFGLYEDDYHFFGLTITSTGWENWLRVKYLLSQFWQGRPLFISIITFLSYWGEKLGGLPLLYAIGYGIVTANAILFYALLRRVSDNTLVVISGALAFALFPADTTHILLTHSFGLRMSLLFILAACYAYVARRPLIAYGFSMCCLLTYETPFTIFFAAPLLLKGSGSERLRNFLKHGLIVAVILVGFIILRKVFGEHFVGTLEFPGAILRPLRQMLVGPLVCVAMFIYRPIEALMTLSSESVIAYSLVTAAYWHVLSQIKIDQSENCTPCSNGGPKGWSGTWAYDLLRPYAGLALAGLVMLILAYPLTFSVPAEAIDGRASRVHLAAMPGASILCGCACSILAAMGHRYGVQRLATAVLSLFFVLLVGFGLTVQRDYTQAWKYQQKFWRQVISLCPDMTERTVILLDPEQLHRSTQIDPFSWSAPFVLDEVYNFPEQWEHKPQLYWLNKGWQAHMVAGDKFSLNDDVVTFVFWWEPERTFESTDLILLEWKNGRMKRLTQPLEIDGRAYALKDSSSPSVTPLVRGNLYKYLISPTSAP